MSKQSSERRSYSVDEMMERLKDGQREKREKEESELVTRPDGSQVVRVRRRKRRSAQPHKAKEARRKRTGLISLIGLVVLVVSCAAAVVILLARFNSKGYRDQLKERILAASGAKVGIDDLSVTPVRARAKSLTFDWGGGGILKSMKLRGISAALKPTSFLGSEWHGDIVNVDSGQLLLGPPDGTINRAGTEGSLPFDYDHYRCGNFDILFGGDRDEAPLRVMGSEVSMRPQDDGSVQFVINGGRAQVKDWEEMRITNGLAELVEGRFQIVSLRVSPPGEDRGEATLRTIKAMRANAPAVVEVELEKYSLDHLLGGARTSLGHFFGGSVGTRGDLPGTIAIDPRFLDSGSMEVAFSGAEGTLQNLMFLRVLGGILRNSDYNTAIEGAISGVVKRDKDGLSLRDLEFDAKALLRVEGNVNLGDEGALSGTLRVGVPQGVFLSSNLDRYQKLFSAPELGYLWVKVSLFGTVERPLDDFGRSVEQAVTPGGTGNGTGLKELLEDQFRQLTEDPEE